MVDDHHYFLFPNTVCNVYAGHFITARIRPDATDAERCYFDMFIFNWLSDEERSERRAARHAAVDEGTEVGRVPDQDFSALPTCSSGCIRTGSRASCSPSRRSASCTSTRSSTSCCSASEFGGEGQRAQATTLAAEHLFRLRLELSRRTVLHDGPEGTRVLCRIMEGPPRGSPHRNRATGRVRLGDGPCHRRLPPRCSHDARRRRWRPHPHGVPGIYEGLRERATRRPDLPVLGSEIHLAEQHPSSRPRYAGGRRGDLRDLWLC